MLERPPAIDLSVPFMKLMADPVIDALIKDINRGYLYWDKVKYKEIPNGLISHEELWTVVKMSRKFSRKVLGFKSFAEQFYLNVTDHIQESLHYFDMNIGGNLASDGIIPEMDKHQYLLSSIMEEAIASSQMEGASTTHRRAKEMLRKEEKPKSRSDQMIVNNYATIRYITENKDEPLDAQKLLYIHRLMTHNTLDNPDDAGRFRDMDDIYVVDHSTSDAVHIPPNHESIDLWIREICAFFNNDISHPIFLHPIIRGIILHFLIAYVHPFTDGNGRTARALFYWYLLKQGYWLTEYLSISRIIQSSKKQYEKAFLYTENDEMDLTYFVQYNIEVMKKAYDSLKAYIAKKVKEQQQNAVYLRIPEINQRQAALVQLLTEKPSSTLTIKEVQNRFGTSYVTARSDINGLVSLGLINSIAVNKKQNNYVRSENFADFLSKLQKIR